MLNQTDILADAQIELVQHIQHKPAQVFIGDDQPVRAKFRRLLKQQPDDVPAPLLLFPLERYTEQKAGRDRHAALFRIPAQAGSVSERQLLV